MIRFPCDHCGKLLAVQDSKAGAVGICPACKKEFRVPGARPAQEVKQQPRASAQKPPPGPTVDDDEEAQQPSLPEPGKSSEDAFPFSRRGLRKAFWWVLSVQLLSLAVLIGGTIGCGVILAKERLSLEVILGVVFVGGTAFVGLCMFLMSLPNWKLLLFSTIPSSSHYLVTRDRLQRYSRAGELVEEIPFANIAEVRLMTRRNEQNPEVTAKVLGIDLRNLEHRESLLDRPYCRWSQTIHQYDLAMIADFFDVPVKTVYRKIKKRWQLWQETHPGAGEDEDTAPRSQPRSPRAWYQKPLTYVFGVLGLCGLGGLVLLLSILLRGKDGDVPVPGPGPGPLPVGKGPEGPLGPRSLPGLVAYWPLDEAKGQVAGDESGKGSPGRIEGAEWVAGVKGSALRLDGKRDFVDLGSERRLDFGPAGPFTVAGWVATESALGVICSFRKQRLLFPIIEISVRQGRLAGWVRDDTSGFGGAKVSGAPVNDGKWHHVALLRYPDGTMELFLDGTSQGRAQGKSSGGPITTDLRALGCDRLLATASKKDPGYFAGRIDEFCVYDRPLAAAELTALAAGKP